MSQPGELQAFTAYTVKVWLKVDADPDVPSVPVSLTDEDGEWVEFPNLLCLEWTGGLSPTLDQATLFWRFGTMANPGDLAMAYVDKLGMLTAYVRVEIPAWEIDWPGVVVKEVTPRAPEESYDPGGGPEQRVTGGDQTFTVAGLEYFLGRTLITHSLIYVPAAGPDPETLYRIDRPIGYNTGLGDGRSISYADRANKDTRGIGFAADADHAELWTAHDILKDLIGYVDESDPDIDYGGSYNPRSTDGGEHPKFRLSAASADYLTTYAPEVRVDGRSLLQVIDDTIDRKRGLTWRLVYDYDHNRAELVVDSMATTDIELPGTVEVIPAASNQITLGDDPRVRPVITKSADRLVDVVKVRGARRRAVFTVGMESENLEESWKATEKTTYDAAASDADAKVNDRFRQAERFERVYSTFHIPSGWNGTANDGGSVPDIDEYACPRPVQGSTTFEEGEVETFSPWGLRLQRTLPILVGWDYADATTPTDRNPDNTLGDFQKPFGVVEVGGQWQFLHRLSEIGDDASNFAKYHLNMLQNAPGLQIRNGNGLNHTAALNHFDPETAASSDTKPEIDYATHRYTVCAEFDGYCEAVWPTMFPDSKPLTIHVIYLGERARYDWLAKNTIYDVEGGVLKKVTTGGALRDDRNLCETVAKIAYEWYATERAGVTLNLNSLDLDTPLCQLGDLITTIGTAEAVDTVNAVVSQIQINLVNGTAQVTAGFQELDFAGLI